MTKYYVNLSKIHALDSDNIAGLRSLAASSQYDGLFEIEIKGKVVADFRTEQLTAEQMEGLKPVITKIQQSSKP